MTTARKILLCLLILVVAQIGHPLGAGPANAGWKKKALAGGGALCLGNGACRALGGRMALEGGKAVARLGRAMVDLPEMTEPMEVEKAPNPLLGFPDAKRTKGKSSIRGGGGPRPRWLQPDGKILEWDSQHGEIEMYDKSGRRHLGAFDPTTGRQIKGPVPGRRVER